MCRCRPPSPAHHRARPTAADRTRSPAPASQDRKSTRLNSSHSQIPYAVFCLKKKNTNTECFRSIKIESAYSMNTPWESRTISEDDLSSSGPNQMESTHIPTAELSLRLRNYAQ